MRNTGTEASSAIFRIVFATSSLPVPLLAVDVTTGVPSSWDSLATSTVMLRFSAMSIMFSTTRVGSSSSRSWNVRDRLRRRFGVSMTLTASTG